MANERYLLEETVTIWRDTGADKAMDLTGLADGAGRVGAQLDLGVDPRPRQFEWRAMFECSGTANSDGVFRLFIATARDGASSNVDGDVGTTDDSVTEEELKDLIPIGFVSVTGTAANTVYRASGQIPEITGRYVSPVVWNASGASTTTTTAENEFILTEVPDQFQ